MRQSILLIVQRCSYWRWGEYFNEVSFANTVQMFVDGHHPNFTTQSNVSGSALAPLCTCFFQCCYLCHKPCRVPFFYLVCVAFPNPAPSLIPLQTLTSVVCNSLSGCQPVVLLLHLCFCFQGSKRINRHCLQNCFVHFFSCLPAFFNVSLFVFSFVKT